MIIFVWCIKITITHALSGREQSSTPGISSYPGQGRARGGIHIQHTTEEDPGAEEGEGESGSQLWTGGRNAH